MTILLFRIALNTRSSAIYRRIAVHACAVRFYSDIIQAARISRQRERERETVAVRTSKYTSVTDRSRCRLLHTRAVHGQIVVSFGATGFGGGDGGRHRKSPSPVHGLQHPRSVLRPDRPAGCRAGSRSADGTIGHAALPPPPRPSAHRPPVEFHTFAANSRRREIRFGRGENCLMSQRLTWLYAARPHTAVLQYICGSMYTAQSYTDYTVHTAGSLRNRTVCCSIT